MQHRGCAACHQVFPASMMTQVGARWVCLICKEKAISEMDGTAPTRYKMTSYVPDYAKWTAIIGIVGFVGYMGFRIWLMDSAADMRRQLAPPAIAQGVAPWAAKPPAEWPALVAPGVAKFRSSIFVGSNQACFVRNEDGDVLALTSVRLSKQSTVLAEDITPAKLGGDFLEWEVGSAPSVLKLAKMRPSGESAFTEGVVVLEVPSDAKTPAPVFTLRQRDYRAGVACFTISRTPEGQQVVRRASVLDSDSADGSVTVSSIRIGKSRSIVMQGDGSATRLHFDEAVRVGDLLGATVVDSDGLLMAIVTAPQADIDEDGKTKTFYAFGMQALRNTVNLQTGRRPMERSGLR
jgi:hypothetical protein